MAKPTKKANNAVWQVVRVMSDNTEAKSHFLPGWADLPLTITSHEVIFGENGSELVEQISIALTDEAGEAVYIELKKKNGDEWEHIWGIDLA